MFALLLLTPLLFSLLCFACRKRGLSATCTVTVLHSLGITLLLILALWVVQTAADAGEIFAAGLWLHIDGLGGLFLAILGVIGFRPVFTRLATCVMKWHTASFPRYAVRLLGFFHLFLFTMLLVVTSNNLIVMWAAIRSHHLKLGVSGRHLRSAFHRWKQHGSTSLFVLLVSLLVCSVPCWYTPTSPALCRRQKWRYSGARFLSVPCLTQH